MEDWEQLGRAAEDIAVELGGGEEHEDLRTKVEQRRAVIREKYEYGVGETGNSARLRGKIATYSEILDLLDAQEST